MEQISSADVRVPRGGDKVYKDQCIYCFQSPVSRASRKLVCHFVTKVDYLITRRLSLFRRCQPS